MKKIIVNTRISKYSLTGLQRYTSELLERFGEFVECVAPKKNLSRSKGHLWEQSILPMRVRNNLLFSPANSGPIMISNQVVTVHDVVQLEAEHVPELTNDIDLKTRLWFQFMTPRLLRRVAHIITISEFTKERILEHIKMDESRITVIPNGVSKKFHPITQEDRAQFIGTIELPTRHYLLCVGTLRPLKNINRLLRAWEIIQTQVPEDVWLVVTGKVHDTRAYAEMCGGRTLPPRVHFTGHVSDNLLVLLYADALAFVYPSLHEGFGLPPLEAMAAGVPVLTGNRSSLPEVVGDAGLMVDPYDVDAIAEGIKNLVEDADLRNELSTKGLLRAKSYSWDTTAMRTLALLQEVGR